MSASPLVVMAVSAGIEDYGSYLAFDDSLGVRATIHAGRKNDPDLLNIHSTAGEPHSRPDYRVLVKGDILVTTTMTAPGKANQLVAFDLGTGTRLWSTAVDGSMIESPVAVDGSTLIVLASAELGVGEPQVVRVTQLSGRLESAKPGSVMSADVGDIKTCRIIWADGRGYAIRWDAEKYHSPLFTVG